MTISLVRADTGQDADALTRMAAGLLPHDPFSEDTWAEPGIDAYWIVNNGDRVGILAAERGVRPAASYFEDSLPDPGNMYLLLIAVQSPWQRQGVATAAIKQFIELARSAGAHCVHSNLRASNTASEKLHLSLGFKPNGRVEDYYPEPREDTLLFRLDV